MGTYDKHFEKIFESLEEAKIERIKLRAEVQGLDKKSDYIVQKNEEQTDWLKKLNGSVAEHEKTINFAKGAVKVIVILIGAGALTFTTKIIQLSLFQ